MIGITSFSSKGYEVYGKKFLESAIKYFPCTIHVYSEDIKDRVESDKIIWKDLNDVHGYSAFQAYCDINPVFTGKLLTGYNYNYDAKRFSNKAFAQFDTLQNYYGKAFWLDADIVFKKEIPKSFLYHLFGHNTLCLLQRKGMYSETGFVGFDTDGIGFEEFLSEYIGLYRTGDLFKLRAWHDSMAIDEAAKRSEVMVMNLTESEGINVLPKSVLGEYMVHNKGDRKFQ